MRSDDGPVAVRTTRSSRFRIGAWTVDPSLDQIERGGQVVKLEPRKMRLLVALADRVGEVVTPDELLDLVWPGLVVTQSSIYQSVAQLRKTLGDSRDAPEYIATVPRKGYRLVAAVVPVEPSPPCEPVAAPSDPPAPADAPVEVPSAPRAEPATLPVPPPQRLLTRRRVLLGSGALTAAAIGAGLWSWSRMPPPIDGLARIAVLPFTDRSQGGLEHAAAEGLANDVIHRFERSDRVLVLARNSVSTLRGPADQPVGLQALRQQLDADYALLGELFRTQQRIRIAVRLLAVPGGSPHWTSVFATPADRLAEIPALIAAGALKALGLPDAPPSELNPLGAYELYLLGADAYRTQRSMEGLLKARDYFQHAIDSDPGYARAYAGLATTWLSQAEYGIGMDFREAAARAQPLIDKALSLDAGLLEGLIVQANLYMDNNWTDGVRARQVMQKAVALYPGHAAARFFLGVTYAYDEQPREAIRHYAKALESDPLNGAFHGRWGIDATFSGDYEAAGVHLARAVELNPKSPWRFLAPAWADYARGHLDDAISNYRRQLEVDARRPDVWGELGWLYLDLGMPAPAREAFAKKRDLAVRTQRAEIDEAYALLLDGQEAGLPAWLAERGLDRPADGVREVDRLMVHAIAGILPTSAAVDALRNAMRADAVPWVGSYWIFQGWFAWIDLAALYALAGSPAAAAPLLDEAQAMLSRLRTRGNAFHAIPFLEARIAALRGTPDVALARLAAAVDAGWRRAWILRFDPAFRRMRDDPRIAPLVERVSRDTSLQRSRVAAAPIDAATAGERSR